MLSNATRLCEAKFGVLMLCEGDAFRAAALHNVPSAFADLLCRAPIRPGPNISFARAAKTKQAVQFADVTNEPSYIERDPLAIAAVELGGYRTVLSVPMLKEKAAGCDEYVSEPYSPRQLLAKIRQYLS
jgi:CheY-like chemotaxis protein